MSKRDKQIMAMLNAGNAPSEIDRRMKLIPGTAHDVIVGMWAYDKEMARFGRFDHGWSK